MIPFSISSEPLLGYADIETAGTDIYEDAFGFRQQFGDVYLALSLIETAPAEGVVKALLLRIQAGEGEGE